MKKIQAEELQAALEEKIGWKGYMASAEGRQLMKALDEQEESISRSITGLATQIGSSDHEVRIVATKLAAVRWVKDFIKERLTHGQG